MAKNVELAVGGQAIIEGVMMRSQSLVGMAARRPDGKIVKKTLKLKKPNAFWRIPFLRGVYNLISMLAVGIKALNWSASQATKEEEKISDWAMFAMLAFSLAFGIALFVLLPYALTFLVGIKEDLQPIAFNLVDGAIKIAILLAYVYGISLFRDVRRMYQYHGAEHKAVYCHESRKPLTVENVRKYSTLHPRCGTSFLFIVIIVGVFVFSFTPLIAQSLYPEIGSIFWLFRRILLFLMRIAFLPVIAGLSYEFLKFSSKFSNHAVLGVLTAPGLMLQKITTREPTKKQIEVAIASLKMVVK